MYLSLCISSISPHLSCLPVSNLVIKFANDTTVIGLITNNDETAYRSEVVNLANWCQENNLTLNVDKTKELVIDYRQGGAEHDPIHINGVAVERVDSFKFLGVHITEKLDWGVHTGHVVKKAQQRLYHLRRLKRFGMGPHILRAFYRGTTESILTGCTTAWFGNANQNDRRALERVVRTAEKICGCNLPSIDSIFTERCVRKAHRILKDPSHPNHKLFELMPSGRRYRSLRSSSKRTLNSYFHRANRLLTERL